MQMKFIGEIEIMPKKELLDPQGKTVCNNLPNIGIEGVQDVRVGKHIVLQLEAENMESAKQKVQLACEKMLANVIMESFTFELTAVD